MSEYRRTVPGNSGLTRRKKILFIVSLFLSLILGIALYVSSFFYLRLGTKLLLNLMGILVILLGINVFAAYLVVLGKAMPKVAKIAIAAHVIFLFSFACAVFSHQTRSENLSFLFIGVGIAVLVLAFTYVVYRVIKDIATG